MDRFIEEANRLVRSYNNKACIVTKYGPKFITLYIFDPTTPATVKETIYAKIDKNTLDIYAPTGYTVRGNINDEYGGIHSIDAFGVIINEKKRSNRLDQIRADQ
jgi:hypothetical protein